MFIHDPGAIHYNLQLTDMILVIPVTKVLIHLQGDGRKLDNSTIVNHLGEQNFLISPLIIV